MNKKELKELYGNDIEFYIRTSKGTFSDKTYKIIKVKCNICKRTEINPKALSTHMRTHSKYWRPRNPCRKNVSRLITQLEKATKKPASEYIRIPAKDWKKFKDIFFENLCPVCKRRT